MSDVYYIDPEDRYFLIEELNEDDNSNNYQE